jgi:hypothetical protein
VLRYAELLEIYRETYPRLQQTYRRLTGFVARALIRGG